MAGPTGPIEGWKSGLYAKAGHEATAAAVPAWSDFVGSGKVVVDVDTAANLLTNKVALAGEIGDISETGNPINYGVYTEDKQRQGTGQSTPDQFEFSVFRNDAAPSAIERAKRGSAWTIAVLNSDGDGGWSIDPLHVEISSRSKGTPIDNMQTVRIQCTINRDFDTIDKP